MSINETFNDHGWTVLIPAHEMPAAVDQTLQPCSALKIILQQTPIPSQTPQAIPTERVSLTQTCLHSIHLFSLRERDKLVPQTIPISLPTWRAGKGKNHLLCHRWQQACIPAVHNASQHNLATRGVGEKVCVDICSSSGDANMLSDTKQNSWLSGSNFRLPSTFLDTKHTQVLVHDSGQLQRHATITWLTGLGSTLTEPCS